MKDHKDPSEKGSPPRSLSLLDAPLSRRKMMATTAALLLPSIYATAEPRPLEGSQPKGRIIVGLSQEPTVFNPLMPGIEADHSVWFALFSTLWRVEPDGSFTPDLATEVPSLENGGISADGLQWKIKLRKGVKWHDGTEFAAEDVKFTLNLLNSPNFRARTRQGHNLVRNITINSPYEISWTMTRAYSPYLSLLTWTFIIPKHILSTAADANTAPFNSAPIGTGPFKWGNRIAGSGVTVEANAIYHGDGPYIARVIFNYVPDSNLLFTQFKTGSIDYAGYYGIPAQDFKEAKTLPDRVVVAPANSNIEGIVLNFGKPYFRDKVVRRALYSAMNKEAIVRLVYYGIPSATESFLPQTSWAFNPNLPKQVYDIVAANKLLDQTGWIRGSDGIRAKNGVRLAFLTATVSGNPQHEQVLQVIQQDWQKIGVAMTIKTMPAAVLFGDYYTKSQFDSLLVASTYGSGADPDSTARFSSSSIPIQGGNGINYSQYKNPEVDKLLQIAQASFNKSERKDVYLRIQSLIRDDLTFFPIDQQCPIEGRKAKLIGYRSNVNVLSNTWNIGSWYWET
jgi:peptide/nickel transport system substrate-binding protein